MLTQERLKELLRYDPETGIFVRLVYTSSNAQAGSIAGCKMNTGYIKITVLNIAYLAHRLAWLYVYGEFPNGQIDHINNIKTDNNICNLREVSNAENAQNKRNHNSNNKLGILGVSMSKGKFKAGIRINRRGINLGTFATKELARDAYVLAKRKIHPCGNL